jgi:Tat protein secretion system quality control protein TatD with DNase activity
MVKGRNEPCAVRCVIVPVCALVWVDPQGVTHVSCGDYPRQVMEVVAGARGVGLEELAAKIHTNTRRVFFP